MCAWHTMVFSMRSLTKLKHSCVSWGRGLCLALALLSGALTAGASEVGVKQVGDDVLLQADVKLPLPVQLESVLRNGVPLTMVHEARITQSRWYWTDKSVLTRRREWTVAYQALTNQWRVSSRHAPTVQQFDDPNDAWRAITQVKDWPLAKVQQLGAMDQAEVSMRWYVKRPTMSGTAIPNLATQSDTDFEAYAQSDLRAIVAPVRDALGGATVKTP